MNKLETYLRQRYSETRWPYYGINHARFDVGSSFDQDVKELREKEMIKPTPGINGWMIEMILINEKWKM